MYLKKLPIFCLAITFSLLCATHLYGMKREKDYELVSIEKAPSIGDLIFPIVQVIKFVNLERICAIVKI